MPTPQCEDAPASLIAGITFPIERRLPTRACFAVSQPSESQNSGRVYPSSDINSRYSRHVTSRFAIWKGSKYTLWRGVSLSKQKSRGFAAFKLDIRSQSALR